MTQIDLPFIEKTFISANTSFEEAKIVILGCPYDGSSTFRPGARFAPSAIRRSSWGIETYSPYFEKDLDSLAIHDMGDIELPLDNKKLSFNLIKRALKKIINAKKMPILLGGDHLITLPVIEELIKIYPDLHIIHFDAHTDLREEYLDEKLSHSTVVKRIIDHIGKGKIVQIGVRSGTRDEFKLAERMNFLISLNKPLLKQIKNNGLLVEYKKLKGLDLQSYIFELIKSKTSVAFTKLPSSIYLKKHLLNIQKSSIEFFTTTSKLLESIESIMFFKITGISGNSFLILLINSTNEFSVSKSINSGLLINNDSVSKYAFQLLDRFNVFSWSKILVDSSISFLFARLNA